MNARAADTGRAILHLAELRIFPVKALRGVACERALVEPWGLAGDRRWMVVDAAGRFLTQREHPAMARIRAEPAPRGIDLHAGARRVAVPSPMPGRRRWRSRCGGTWSRRAWLPRRRTRC